MKSKTKSAIRLILLIGFLLPLSSFPAKSLIHFGCSADDEGECVAKCDDGSPCCVGISPNCKESTIDEETLWIDCGDGVMHCTREVIIQ